MLDVCFYEIFKEEEESVRRILPKGIKAAYRSQTIQESGHTDIQAPLISVRTQSVIPPSWANDLNGILTRSTGYDHLLAYRTEVKKNIPCGYLPSYCARAVAEQSILMMMALLRKLPLQIKNFAQFSRDGMTGCECQNRNLLVIGVGRIGSEVVGIARGLKMNVQGVDIVERLKDINYVSLRDGIKWAHAIVCAAPLTAQTRSLLGHRTLQHAQEGLVLVNIARGEITPLEDLNNLLESGLLGGLGLDVYEDEKIIAKSLRTGTIERVHSLQLINALQARDNVICTPHNAFNTNEALERKSKQTVESVISFLEKGLFQNPIPQQ